MLQADSTLCIAKPQNSIGFNIKSLPKGGPNVGIVIPFVCPCPPQCICGGKQINNWYHQICGCPLYLNSNGEIFCQNFKTKKECQQIFIQKAKFKCNKATSNQQFKQLANFLLAIATSFIQSDLKIGDSENLSFNLDLNKQTMKRWER